MYSDYEIPTDPFPERRSSLDQTFSETKYSNSTDGYEEALAEFAVLIEKLTPLLEEMKDKKLMASPEMQQAVKSVEAEYNRAKLAMSSQNFESSPAKQIEDLTQSLGRSLGLVLFSGYEVPIHNIEKIDALRKAIMNAKFGSSWEHGSVSTNDVETEEITEIAEEETEITLDIEDVVFKLSCCKDEEEFSHAVSDLKLLISENQITDDIVDKESLISILCDRLSTAKSDDRLAIIQILRSLIKISDRNKERMADVGILSLLVKSLAREAEERREAVGLLSYLFDIPDVRKRIGRIKGCIVMLVSILRSDDQVAMLDAAKLLDSLSSNPQYALNMAEAGYFNPLLYYLKKGSDMNKILMATALGRMQITDQSKASLGEEGAVELLVNMFISGNFEAKLSALNSLKKICTLKENIHRLVNCGFVPPLLQLLFSVTSVLMALREPASAILALIAQVDGVLIKHDVAQQMLSLLNLTSPVIQMHLLNALNGIANHASASKVRRKMREQGAFRFLVPFIMDDTRPKTMILALQLMYKLSKGRQEQLMEQLGETNISRIANILTSSASMDAKAAAIGVLSNLPTDDKRSTDILKNAMVLPLLISLLSETNESATCTSAELPETISEILLRFTTPSDKNLQRYAVENGVVPSLVRLLSVGSALAKSKAATCLAQLSQNSLSMTDSRRSRWFCVPHSVNSLCEVHDQHCSITSTFCLVKANAIPPLIKILGTDETDAHEAVLCCLSTLLNGKTVENGSNFIAKNSGIILIIETLNSGNTKTKEKALWMLQRIFSIEAHRVEYGDYAQAILLELAQHGDAHLRPALALVLAQLELLQVQSSYF